MQIEVENKFRLTAEKVDLLLQENLAIGRYEFDSPVSSELVDRYWDFIDHKLFKETVYLRTRRDILTRGNVITLRSFPEAATSGVLHITEINNSLTPGIARNVLRYVSDSEPFDMGGEKGVEGLELKLKQKNLKILVELWNKRTKRKIFENQQLVGIMNIDNYVAFTGPKAVHSYELEIDFYRLDRRVIDNEPYEGPRSWEKSGIENIAREIKPVRNALSEHFTLELKTLMDGELEKLTETKIQRVVRILGLQI